MKPYEQMLDTEVPGEIRERDLEIETLRQQLSQTQGVDARNSELVRLNDDLTTQLRELDGTKALNGRLTDEVNTLRAGIEATRNETLNQQNSAAVILSATEHQRDEFEMARSTLQARLAQIVEIAQG